MHLSDDMYDITLGDIKRGHFIRNKRKNSISEEVKTIKQCKTYQLFKLPTSKGQITDTFSSSPTARDYNRVWLKVPSSYYRRRVPVGQSAVVPYDDPTGEIMLVKQTQKVLAYNIKLNEDFS